MHIDFVIFPFIILLGLLLPNNDKNRKVFIIIVLSVLALESALRSLFLVADTYSYYEWFTLRIPGMSWGEIWYGFVDRYFGDREHDIDYGFIILMKLLSYVTNSFPLFTLLSQLIFYIPMGLFLYKYSNNNRQIIFAFVFFVALLQVSAIGGGRQLLARGCWFMIYILFDEKKYGKAVLWLLLGLSFHFSVLIVLVAVGLMFLNSKQLKTIHFITFFFIPFFILSPRVIISFMGGLVGSERYANYGAEGNTMGMLTFVVLMEVLSLLCFFLINKDTLDSNHTLKKLYTLLPCLTLTTPLALADGAMIRLGSYFHMFMMLIVPMSFEETKDKDTISAMYVISLSLLLFMALKDGGHIYYFYWQDPGFF